MRTVHSSSRLLGGRGGGEGVRPGWVVSAQTPPREQNDRRLWKHYLAATTLRMVKMASAYISHLCKMLKPCLHLAFAFVSNFKHAFYCNKWQCSYLRSVWCQEWVRTHCLWYMNVMLNFDNDFDIDANADITCEQGLNSVNDNYVVPCWASPASVRLRRQSASRRMDRPVVLAPRPLSQRTRHAGLKTEGWISPTHYIVECTPVIHNGLITLSDSDSYPIPEVGS